jgi:hypothetical protein
MKKTSEEEGFESLQGYIAVLSLTENAQETA